MKNAIKWFEIPVADLARAKEFYESIFDFNLRYFNLNAALQMAVFPSDSDGVGGALCYSPDFYIPGHQGPLLYLNANPDLQKVLDRVEMAGGEILRPRMMVSPEIGFMAVIQDSEGNRISLMAEK